MAEDKHLKMQVNLWLDSILESMEGIQTKINKMTDVSEIDNVKALKKIRDQYRTIEIIYRVESGKTTISGIQAPSKKAKR